MFYNEEGNLLEKRFNWELQIIFTKDKKINNYYLEENLNNYITEDNLFLDNNYIDLT